MPKSSRPRKRPAAGDGRYKRRFPIDTAVRIRLETWDRFQTDYAGNISEGGIFIRTEKPLKPGTRFALELIVGGEKLLANAQVIWTKEFPPGTSRPSGMGARFVRLDEESRAVLGRWIDAAIASDRE